MLRKTGKIVFGCTRCKNKKVDTKENAGLYKFCKCGSQYTQTPLMEVVAKEVVC